MSLYSSVSMSCFLSFSCFFFFKQKTAYEMRISDWSSDVCSSDLIHSNKPYTTCQFYERVGVLRYEFLSPDTVKKLDEFMPSIVKLEYTRRDGMSFYDIGPVDPQDRKSTRLNSSH